MNYFYELPKGFDFKAYGSCMAAAEKISEQLLEQGIDFLVIEGYITVIGTDWEPSEHTWIELASEERIDPTIVQFTDNLDRIRYSKIKYIYTGEEYLELCGKYPSDIRRFLKDDHENTDQ